MTDPAAVYPSLPSARTDPLPLATTVPGPCVIGATGGSGTRVVAGIARESGMFIGARLNPYEDAVAFGEYSDRWIDRFVERAGEAPEKELLGGMQTDLEHVVQDHLAELPPEARAWGWKEPRSIYLVPFFDATMPSLRFLHFLRDGRDMAFSENQNQLVRYGDLLVDDRRREKKPVRSIALWSLVNSAAADYGETRLGDRYLRVRFEDLCAEPAETVRRIYDFFGLEGDAEAIAAAEVRPPSTLARWTSKSPRTISKLEQLGEPALTRFG
ncbi:MAG TPA: sulfotransferase, partial [Gaiellaceae bacterium]|nr:sulfotransferase [Gaiellaceae bacterium]